MNAIELGDTSHVGTRVVWKEKKGGRHGQGKEVMRTQENEETKEEGDDDPE